MVLERMIQSKNVCVIGAGPSGLVASRELRKEGHIVVVMEQNHDVGGQWLYEPNVDGKDPLGRQPFLKVHSSMYDSVRLMSPREIMGYSDFPFLVKKDRDSRRYPGHREVLSYLQDFCEWFGLRDMIRFNTRVEYAGMLNYSNEIGDSNNYFNSEDLKWVVRSRDMTTSENKVVEEIYDAVVVATGHYSHPRIPSIKGMDVWKKKQLHSHIYRVPESFRDEVVVVIGNSLSGQDISVELSGVAKEVYLSSRSLEISEGLSKVISKHQNLHLYPEIESVEEDGRVLFIDGSWVTADALLYCTGLDTVDRVMFFWGTHGINHEHRKLNKLHFLDLYGRYRSYIPSKYTSTLICSLNWYSYKFPFLDTNGIVKVDDDRVGPSFEHTFPPSLAPSLSFIGIPRKLIGFPFFESQAKWIAQLLSGKRTLPTRDEMMKSTEEFYKARDAAGIPKHNTHDLADFEYCDRYGDYVDFPHLEEWRKVLCKSSLVNATANLETFRYKWENDNEVLLEALRSPHFTQLGHEDLTIKAYGLSTQTSSS